MTEQEIRVKSLELTIQLIALMPEAKRQEQLSIGNPTQVIIELSQEFQTYLRKSM